MNVVIVVAAVAAGLVVVLLGLESTVAVVEGSRSLEGIEKGVVEDRKAADRLAE